MKYCPICEKNYGNEAAVCEIDGSLLRDAGPRQDEFVGKEIKGRYRVLDKLGEGGMAVVYLAEQINIERKVALKLLNRQYSGDPEFVRRFRQEARLAASLNHSNVVRIYDFDQAEDGSLFIAMEFLQGKNLKELIQGGPVGVEKAVSLGIQIAEGLATAHRAGVVHRDIKPENIMVVGEEQEIKLMDFGIARLQQSGGSTRLTRTGMIVGTPLYMAPEQIEGGEVTERTDIYAFGIVLYEMLCGAAPFQAPTPAAILMKHLKDVPAPIRKLRAEVPPGIERIVAQTLEKRMERRPGSMAEVASALRKEQGQLLQRAMPDTLVAAQVLEVGKGPGLDQSFSADGGLLEKLGLRFKRRERREGEKGSHPGEIRESNEASVAPAIGSETIAETMATTAPRRFSEPRAMSWKWLGLGIGGVFIVVVGGVMAYLQFDSRPERAPAGAARTGLGAWSEARIVSFAIQPEKRDLAVKERVGVRFNVEYESGRKEQPTEGVQWWSSDPSVLDVGPTGTIEGKTPGRAEIMARYRGVEAPPFTVAVTKASPDTSAPGVRIVSLAIRADRTAIGVQERATLRVDGTYSGGQQRRLDKGIRWESSDPTVARITPRGEIQGRKEGSARITARYQGVASEPVTILVRALPKAAPPAAEESPAVKAGIPEGKEAPADAKQADLRESIRVVRAYRDRGEYSKAFSELEKIRKVNPANKELQAEIAATTRACNAERALGRTELRC